MVVHPKACEILSANLSSDCKEYYHYVSQRFHRESVMLNKGLTKFPLLPDVTILTLSREVPGLNIT